MYIIVQYNGYSIYITQDGAIKGIRTTLHNSTYFIHLIRRTVIKFISMIYCRLIKTLYAQWWLYYKYGSYFIIWWMICHTLLYDPTIKDDIVMPLPRRTKLILPRGHELKFQSQVSCLQDHFLSSHNRIKCMWALKQRLPTT